MDDTYVIQLDNGSDSAAIRAVQTGLSTYNLGFAPSDGYQPLNVFIRGRDGSVLGGLLGVNYWGWLHVDILWLDERLRGQKLGSHLLNRAEEEAIQRGCRHVHLDTLDFQALPFYQKRGYTLFGVLDDLPPGHQRFFLRKDLV